MIPPAPVDVIVPCCTVPAAVATPATLLVTRELISSPPAALSLMDIFAARYAHAHTYDEVCEWYREAGFETPRLCALERRGFSVCGTRKDIRDESRMKSMSNES